MKLPPAMHLELSPQSTIRDRSSDFQNLVAAEVTRLKPPGDQSLLTSAATVFDAAPPSAAAFTRAELLITLAVLSLLVAIVLPALAHDRARSARIICANNLRQISVAQQLWGNDHNDLPPVMVPVNQGGTRAHPLAANAWLHFAWLSNELATPKVIFCPSDTGKPAEEFTGSPTNGYLNPNFANRATSYFVGYSSFSGDPQQAIIGGDRNVTIDGGTAGCSLLNVASRIDRFGGLWTTNLHNLVGNAQARDGSVEMLSSEAMQARLLRMFEDNASKHIAIPR